MALVRRLRLVVLVIAAASAGYLGARVLFAPPAPPPVVRATIMPQAIALPALSLVDQDGRPMTRDAFADRWTIVFFGFTACPDVCPTTLAMLAQVERQLRELPAAERPIEVKIRSRHGKSPARVVSVAGDTVEIRFDESQRAVTPGQAAVF